MRCASLQGLNCRYGIGNTTYQKRRLPPDILECGAAPCLRLCGCRRSGAGLDWLAGLLAGCVCTDAPLLKEPEPSLWQPGSCALMANGSGDVIVAAGWLAGLLIADCWLSGDGSGMSRADRREVWTFCNTFMRINRMLVDYKVRRAGGRAAVGGRADMCVWVVCAQTNHCPSGFNSQRNLLLHEIDHASSACKRDSKRCWTRVS